MEYTSFEEGRIADAIYSVEVSCYVYTTHNLPGT